MDDTFLIKIELSYSGHILKMASTSRSFLFNLNLQSEIQLLDFSVHLNMHKGKME